MSAIVIDDHIVHYEVLGRGRPLLLLHGWVGSWRYWIPTMQAVSTEFRAYALDLWGFGDTDHAKSNYSIESQTQLVQAFMINLGVPRAAIIGHGLGGLVAMRLAASAPELIDRMMLVNVPLSPEGLHARLIDSSATELAEWLLHRDSSTEAVYVEVQKTDPEALRRWMPTDATALTPKLDSLEPPCLLVQGAKDPAVQISSALASQVESTKNHHIEFDESGHFPMLEEATKFTRLLTEFLSLPPGEPVIQLQLKSEWKRRVR